VEGILDPPPGDVLLVLRRKPGFLDLFRAQSPTSATVTATPER
jgi:hypothetical protein